MANYRLPGPTCTSRHAMRVDDGTGGLMPSCRPGPLADAAPSQASWDDPLTLWRRAASVRNAYRRALALAPGAVLRETEMDLRELLSGLLPGLLAMLVVLAATSSLGGAAGAAVGALLGGIGAAPGAAIGAQAGLDTGMALLTWLGLGFLAAAVARGIPPLMGHVVHAVRRAWNACDAPDERRQVEDAARELADSAAQLIKLVLMAIVVYLSKNTAMAATGRAGESMSELLAMLRRSRLGSGFAAWVEGNAPTLLGNPKLQPNTAVRSSSSAKEAVTPSSLRPGETPRQAPSGAPPVSAPPPAAAPKVSAPTPPSASVAQATIDSLPAADQASVRATLQHIDNGTKPSGPLAKKWGTQFKNRGGDLPGPSGAASPYREYRVAPSPGVSGAGVNRIVVDQQSGAVYYTWTHYGDTGSPAFVQIR